MRIFNPMKWCMAALLALFSSAMPTLALDPNKASVAPTVLEAFELGKEALRSGDHSSASSALEYAASNGHILAQWKLAKMYADGDGVAQNHQKAFNYFSSIANNYADIPPGSRVAPVVSNSFIEVGKFYLSGIPDSNVKANPLHGMNLLAHAGSYFGDADAQYTMGKVYAEGHENAISKNSRKAVRWLRLAARNNHSLAQAYLGKMLVTSDSPMNLQAEGLMWLEVANQTEGEKNPWIKSVYHEVRDIVSLDALKSAGSKAKNWIKKHIDD